MLDKAIEVMKNELECVKRNGECNQTCEECNLVYKCDELVEVYEWIIDQMEKQKKIINKINRTPAEINLLRRYNILN
jgi:hypothetical protein